MTPTGGASIARCEALGRLPAEHPYGLVGRAGVSAAIEWFKGRIAEGPRAPYAYVGDGEQNVLLPTAVGAVAPAGVVPETMAGGDLRGGGRVCVVGFRGLKDFFPALVADNLSRGPDGVTARAVELDLRPEGRADPNALAYARAFDDEDFRAEVVSQLVARVDAGRAGRVPRRARARLAARGVGGDGAPLRPAGLRDSDAAAVRARHPGLHDAGEAADPRRRARGAQQRHHRRRALRRSGADAARAGRAARE